MTAQELIKKFNDEFGLNEWPKKWPKTYAVDAETYANCCQAVFNNVEANSEVLEGNEEFTILSISVGIKNNGIMFKNVELILEPNFGKLKAE